MGAIPERTITERKSKSGKKSILMIGGILGAIAAVGLVYLTVYVEPELIQERVKVIAMTESGCIAEIFDGFPVNIGQCNAQPGDTIMAHVDQKVKERAKAMNPTD